MTPTEKALAALAVLSIVVLIAWALARAIEEFIDWALGVEEESLWR